MKRILITGITRNHRISFVKIHDDHLASVPNNRERGYSAVATIGFVNLCKIAKAVIS